MAAPRPRRAGLSHPDYPICGSVLYRHRSGLPHRCRTDRFPLRADRPIPAGAPRHEAGHLAAEEPAHRGLPVHRGGSDCPDPDAGRSGRMGSDRADGCLPGEHRTGPSGRCAGPAGGDHGAAPHARHRYRRQPLRDEHAEHLSELPVGGIGEGAPALPSRQYPRAAAPGVAARLRAGDPPGRRHSTHLRLGPRNRRHRKRGHHRGADHARCPGRSGSGPGRRQLHAPDGPHPRLACAGARERVRSSPERRLPGKHPHVGFAEARAAPAADRRYAPFSGARNRIRAEAEVGLGRRSAGRIHRALGAVPDRGDPLAGGGRFAEPHHHRDACTSCTPRRSM